MNENSALDLKSLLRLAHSNGLGDGFLPFWAGMLSEVLAPIGPTSRVLEFGATNPKFLRFVQLAYPFRTGLGVVLDVDAIEGYETWTTAGEMSCRFISESSLVSESGLFDSAFSHELFSLLPDLSVHANVAWRLLAPGGTYYAAFGWHGTNPYISRQAKLRADRNLPFHPYQLDTVAETFHAVGFEVGYKRLTMPYFMMYDPRLVKRRFGGVTEMIECLQDHKILFSFRKESSAHGET